MTARDRSRHRGPGVPAGRMMASEQQSVLDPGVPEVPGAPEVPDVPVGQIGRAHV